MSNSIECQCLRKRKKIHLKTIKFPIYIDAAKITMLYHLFPNIKKNKPKQRTRLTLH